MFLVRNSFYLYGIFVIQGVLCANNIRLSTPCQNPTITRSPEQSGKIAEFLNLTISIAQQDCKEELADQLVSYKSLAFNLLV
jgi:hypothetical protein